MSRKRGFRDPPSWLSRRLRLRPPKDFSSKIVRKNHSKEELADEYDYQSCILEAAERKIMALQNTIQNLLAGSSTLEYTIGNPTDGTTLLPWLQGMGQLGWRLCSVATGSSPWHIFCRPRPAKPKPKKVLARAGKYSWYRDKTTKKGTPSGKAKKGKRKRKPSN